MEAQDESSVGSPRARGDIKGTKIWRKKKNLSKLSDNELQDALYKAHNTLILSLGDGVLREVGDKTTVVGLWKKLEDLYIKKSLIKRLCTKKRLYTLQMEEGSSLSTHIDNFNKIILDLEDISSYYPLSHRSMSIL